MKTRFAPSPTGYLHIGGVRTALFSWLLARQQQGKFVLRIEDTDRERSTQESVDAILAGMEWLGLDWDEGPFYQTERFDRYKEVIQQLLDSGNAYYCYSTPEEVDAMREAAKAKGEKPKYDGTYRDFTGTPPEGREPVVRFKNPLDGVVAWDDQIKGRIEIGNAELDDLVIARRDGVPTYNLTVVVDDLDMGISHVLRGDDHINNTPRQINIMKALGAEPPVFGHAPMILGADGSRLSKRHGAVSVLQYRDDGYLPEALLNYLVRLGWSHGDQEVISINEMIELFKPEAVNKAASTFDPEKLRWLNQQYLRQLDSPALATALEPFCQEAGFDTSAGADLGEVALGYVERTHTLVELAEAVRCYYADFDDYDAKAAKKHMKAAAIPVLAELQAGFAAIDDWQAEALHAVVHQTAERLEVGLGKVGPPLRVSLLGAASGPDIGLAVQWLGKERVLVRLAKAQAWVEAKVAAQ